MRIPSIFKTKKLLVTMETRSLFVSGLSRSNVYVKIALDLAWLEADQRTSHDSLPLQRVVTDVNEKVTVGPSLILASDLTVTTRALVHNESSATSDVLAVE